MMMYAALALCLSLGIGYGVCVLAGKQKAEMKTLGFALGIAILAIAFGAALIKSNMNCMMKNKMMWKKCGMMGKQGGMMKNCPMMKK